MKALLEPKDDRLSVSLCLSLSLSVSLYVSLSLSLAFSLLSMLSASFSLISLSISPPLVNPPSLSPSFLPFPTPPLSLGLSGKPGWSHTSQCEMTSVTLNTSPLPALI